MKSKFNVISFFLFSFFTFFFPAAIFGQTDCVASRTDGVNVFYYDSLHEALAAATAADAVADTAAASAVADVADNEAATIERPDEITLLADLVLDEPLIVDDGMHIRLVAGAPVTLNRSANLIEFPVIWVRGESASLSLGKPDMGHELVIDGGFLNSQPIEAHAPLASISGRDSKLIMYDKVTLQNNKNSGAPLGYSDYENGAGVFIRTQGDDTERLAEFIMRGGTIRGNINSIRNQYSCGGGVCTFGFGVFTMEGGVIMNNTAGVTGGGFHTGNRASFTKTGGIIYGSNAPAGYRNTVLKGDGSPKTYGHAVCVAIFGPSYQFRNDTVGESDNLSYAGVPQGSGTFGTGDKWDNPDKVFLRMLAAIILPVLAASVCVFLVYRKRTLRKVMKLAQEAANSPEKVFENVKLTTREKEVGKLLLSELSMKQIADVMEIAYTTADFHSRKLYRKMGVQGRTELLVKSKGMGSGE